MKLPRPAIRTRLTALYAAILLVAVALLLLVSYELMAGHLRRTLREPMAEEILDRLAGQYLLATAGVALVAIGLGWLAAGRALAPLKEITATARRVSDQRLDERIALDGPDDEVHELADTIDAMLDRLQAGADAQRRFIANASHELRSPLTVIRTEADVTLGDRHATVEELRRMGEVVLEATDRTDALLESLMLLARSQPELLRRDGCDLRTVAQKAAGHVAAEARAAELHLAVTGETAPVVGDLALLERTVGNLVENAVRHNEPGGFVKVQTGRDGQGCSFVRVENTGRTVPAAEMARLTEPFERLDRATSGRSGTGLGLSIVRAVVAAHGGRLVLTPRDGGGLVAEVRLRPGLTGPAAPHGAAAGGTPSAGSPRAS